MMDLINQEKIATLAKEIGPENVPVLLDIFLGELTSYQATLLEADTEARLEHLKEISHALKSSAASFGADRLCALAIDIDMRGKQQQLEDIAQETEALVELLRLTHESYAAFSPESVSV
ncbi:quorum-sensing phosphorelay protein LuxU [Vibrio quintilis]|uniref:quorum-sensing phosphorelay protein LuxU n=1 Tax=Vibrio quintilis TaxID=1117707 RepID=UPI00190EAC53|nr:quorum-sensing phosphorelay protein LuxU [Vibrio quintilis]